MNVSRRKLFQLMGASLVVAGAGSLTMHAVPAHAQTISRSQVMRLAAAGLRSRTATLALTNSFAQELRNDRDQAIKRMVTPYLAGRLMQLPLATRVKVADEVLQLIGHSGSAMLPMTYAVQSKTQGLMAVVVASTIDLFPDLIAANLDPDHPCFGLEQDMNFLYDIADQMHKAWLACRLGSSAPTPTPTEGGGSESGGARIFVASSSDSTAPGTAEQCQDLWEDTQAAGAAFIEASNAFSACMARQ